MSTETIRLFRRIASVGMCAAMLMSYSLILAPGVGAASDTNKTETATKDSANIMSAEDALLESGGRLEQDIIGDPDEPGLVGVFGSLQLFAHHRMPVLQHREVLRPGGGGQAAFLFADGPLVVLELPPLGQYI